jgi:STE24 endopeptidase
VIFDFGWDQILNYLDRKQMSQQIPKQLQYIYNSNSYTKQQLYQKENSYFKLISKSFSFIIIMIILFTRSFGYLDTMLRIYIQNTILLSVIFLEFIILIITIINFPFNWYITFVIESKFGFNKTTKKLFISDWLKNMILNIIVGGLILSIIIYIYQHTNKYFWILSWGIVSTFSILISLFYSEWIVPLFNKQIPLDNGDLRSAIELFTKKTEFKLSNIYVIDGSKRSTKGNAYFTGIGSKKRIVFYDTLIKELNTEEIVSVLAHEIGHYKKKHILYSITGSLITMGITFYVLSLFINNSSLTIALGGKIPSFHLGLIGFSFLFTPISEFIGLLFLFFSRKNEYKADEYAASFGLKENLINGLKKLSVKSLNNLNPHKLVILWRYSHPTLLQRIKNLSK